MKIMLVSALASVLGLSLLPTGPKVQINEAGSAWAARCLADFQTVKPGMTRLEVERQFPMDGGMHGMALVPYTHPSCRMFKIDVEFECQHDKADMGRLVKGPDDKVIRVSKPYLEAACYD